MAGRAAGRAGGVYVALLRGINVGGKNKLPMPELAAIFERVACTDIRTYIQSGNVVFRAGPALAMRIPDLVAREIADRFGYRVPLVTRTAGELRRVVRQNPFLRQGVDPAILHVAFLGRAPSRAALAGLDPDHSPPDAYVVRGREIYLCCPTGMARTGSPTSTSTRGSRRSARCATGRRS